MMVLRSKTAGGQQTVMPFILMILGNAVIGFLLVSVADRSDKGLVDPRPAFSFYGSVANVYASMGMVAFTLHRKRAAAFLQTLPPLYPPRALLLLPMFAVGLALSVLAMLFVPPLAALAFLGWWCFAATIGYRFAGRGSLFLFFVALPLSYFSVGASAVAYSTWHWAGAAAASLLLAAVGYATSPHDRTRDITLQMGAADRSLKPSRANVIVPRPRWPGALGATLRAFNHTNFLGGAVRLPRVVPLLMVGFFATYGLISWVWPFGGFTTFTVFYSTSLFPAFWLSSSCVPEKLAFMSTLPLRVWQRRWASSQVLICGVLLLAVLAPLRSLVMTTVDRDDLRKLPYSAATIAAVVGAPASTASPPKSERRLPRPVPVSPALRSLLLRFFGTLALLHWAVFSGIAGSIVGRARKSRAPHLWLGGFAAIASGMIAQFATFGSKEGALAPLWVAAVFATVGTFELRRSLRLPLRA